MILYAAAIFLGAFLLFLVQPIIAKQILPWFGGSAAVWATCMVFFQMILLVGYAYADLTTRRLTPKRQATLHVALLALSLLVLPITPDPSWKPHGDENPSWRILGLLALTVGLPYLLLSTTSPLLQAWFARRFRHAVPYRLFALSNLASLVALLAFPFLVEPWITTLPRGTVHLVHVLPWRIEPRQAAAAPADDVLPDDFARRRPGRIVGRAGGAVSPAGLLRAGHRARRVRAAALLP